MIYTERLALIISCGITALYGFTRQKPGVIEVEEKEKSCIMMYRQTTGCKTQKIGMKQQLCCVRRDYSTLYNILSESYCNFMSLSPLANATKRGSSSGSYCYCRSGCKAAPVAGVIKLEPLGSSCTAWDWAVKRYSGSVWATVGQRCQEKAKAFLLQWDLQ